MWLSMFIRASKSYFVCCASAASGNAIATNAPIPSNDICSFVRMLFPLRSVLEIEVKSQQQTVAAQICSSHGRRAPLPDPGILVMEGEPSAARHEGVVAISNDIVVDVTQVSRAGRKCLLRHAHPFRTLEDGELRAVDIMSLDEGAVPYGIPRSGRKNACGVVLSGGVASAADDVTVTGAKPGAIRSVLGEDLEVQMAAEVEKPFEADPAKALIADSRTRDRHPAAGQICSRGHAVHGVPADTLHSEFAGAERLTAGEKRGVRILAVGQVNIPVGRTEDGG